MKTRSTLSAINAEIPAMTKDKEGKLLGGFAAFGVVGRSGNGNTRCENNDSCDNNTDCMNNFKPDTCNKNGGCTNSCTRPASTEAPTQDTNTKSGAGGKSFFDITALF